MKRARPQGLGSISKKEKANEEIINDVAKESDLANSGEVTGSQQFYELPEDATALDQLRALFESATMFLDDADKAKLVFNGVVHECLRLEAILENENGPEQLEGDEKDLDSFVQVKKDSDKIFGAEFYYIFGESLRTLAELEMGAEIEETSLEQVKGLLSASIDRFQLAKEKEQLRSQETSSYLSDLSNGLLYSMSSLFVLINDVDGLLKKDLMTLIKEETKESLCSAIFDAIEFFCVFLETANEVEFELEESSVEELSDLLESNIIAIEEIFNMADDMKLKLIKVDVPLRLAILKSDEIGEEKANKFLADLEDILKCDVSLRFDALQLKASIKEILGLEEEAALIYEEADSLQTQEDQ